jgi:hypothetical protein
VSLEAVEESYRLDCTPELCIPVRRITVSSAIFPPCAALDQYLGRLDQPPSARGSGNPEATYLFHGCGNAIDDDVVKSFSRRGPSVRFARSRSYFSACPAVYWSNSIEFAIAWSFFAETGDWNWDRLDGRRAFQCLIFVSKPDLSALEQNLYLVPRPRTTLEEEELADVSHMVAARVVPDRDRLS